MDIRILSHASSHAIQDGKLYSDPWTAYSAVTWPVPIRFITSTCFSMLVVLN